ncbi:hypothetical protein SCALM49S_09831 [Streptomyces californicus]
MAVQPEGTPCWADAMFVDIEGAKSFYGDVLGWTFGESASEFGDYTQAFADGRAAAAVVPPMPGADDTSAWCLYFASPDAAATAVKVRDNGGEVLMEPMRIGDFGTMALARDPGGAVFGIWQAGRPGGGGGARAGGRHAGDRPGEVDQRAHRPHLNPTRAAVRTTPPRTRAAPGNPPEARAAQRLAPPHSTTRRGATSRGTARPGTTPLSATAQHHFARRHRPAPPAQHHLAQPRTAAPPTGTPPAAHASKEPRPSCPCRSPAATRPPPSSPPPS